jgi:folylpolyglutamate synthase
MTPIQPNKKKKGLAGTHQRQNANLAVHVAHAFLRSHDSIALPTPFVNGLEKARWPGRCQEVVDSTDPQTRWFLDGAHTVESLDCCMDWFVDRLVALSSTCVCLFFRTYHL